VPLLVGNIGPDTFGQDDNALLLVDETGSTELPRAPIKLVLARQLVAEIARRLPGGQPGLNSRRSRMACPRPGMRTYHSITIHLLNA
jgi:hypothetical protein